MTLPPSCAQNHAVPADRSSRSSMISCALDCTFDLRPLRLRPSKLRRGPWVCARVSPTTTFGSSSSRLKGPLTGDPRSEEHTSELQSPVHLVCRLLLEKKQNLLVHGSYALLAKKTCAGDAAAGP